MPPGHTRSMGGGSLTDGILVVKRVTRERERRERISVDIVLEDSAEA